ncbi:MAG: hypothetical protein IT290_11255 [Deltaproteobacteria bacterium]|nr:hypothetical protein [Deltaproteobacteria bacterium]
MRSTIRAQTPLHLLSRVVTLVTLAVASVASLAQVAEAQIFDQSYRREQGVAVSASGGLFSDRVFRGQNLYNGSSLQLDAKPELRTDWGSIYGGFFTHVGLDQNDPRLSSSASFDTTDSNGNDAEVAYVTPGFNEFDFDLGTEFELEVGSLSVGHKWYNYDASSPRLVDTAELYTGLKLDVFLNPEFLLAYDWDQHEGAYFQGSIDHPIPLTGLNGSAAIIPELTIGFSSGLDNGENPIYESSGTAFLDLALRGEFPIAEGFSVEPELHYNEGIDDASTSDFWFGVKIAGQFASPM